MADKQITLNDNEKAQLRIAVQQKIKSITRLRNNEGSQKIITIRNEEIELLNGIINKL